MQDLERQVAELEEKTPEPPSVSPRSVSPALEPESAPEAATPRVGQPPATAREDPQPQLELHTVVLAGGHGLGSCLGCTASS